MELEPQGSDAPEIELSGADEEGAALMRIAVIGVGRMGVVHAGTLASFPAVDVLVTDVDRDRGGIGPEGVGGGAAGDVGDAMKSSEAVVIAAATDAHAPLVHQAAEAGLPTFCEKPISLDVASTAEVVAHVRDAAIPFQMGFQRRFDEGFRAARD